MNKASIVCNSFDSKDVFNKDKFNIDFKYDNNKYTAIVYFKKETNIELEESLLTIRQYSGEY